MSSHSRLTRRWQCPQCGLKNTASSHNCMACFKSRYPSNLSNVNNSNYRSRQYNRRPDKRVISNNNNSNNIYSSNIKPYYNQNTNNHSLNNRNNNNHKVVSLKSTSSRPRPSSYNNFPVEPMKISDCIYEMSVVLLSGYIRSEIDEYLYPENDLILLINLYLSDGALYRCYTQQNQWIMNNGLKLISSMGGYTINGKGIAVIGFNINARNRQLLYEWTVNIRTFNPPDSFIGIIANNNSNIMQMCENSGSNNISYPTYGAYNCSAYPNQQAMDGGSFDYAQLQYCNGIGGERHRVYRMGKLDRKIKYKSGWHCNNVSHWNDNYDIVKCRYDGRYRQLSFTKYIRNTQKFKLICTIQLPSQLPNNIHSWCPAIYLGHISDSCTVQY
mmetsp:Transcript_42729/g.37951  ORF Transcript_42729/g.37951 Transcript_42729/m.37951 type:complete len:385 (-) Transcript_42729:1076-2230(-)